MRSCPLAFPRFSELPKRLEKAAGEDLLAWVSPRLGSDFAARANIQNARFWGSLISRNISLIARFNSLLCGKKFPVLVRREFARKILMFRLFLLM